jgi:hypothetical protein
MPVDRNGDLELGETNFFVGLSDMLVQNPYLKDKSHAPPPLMLNVLVMYWHLIGRQDVLSDPIEPMDAYWSGSRS